MSEQSDVKNSTALVRRNWKVISFNITLAIAAVGGMVAIEIAHRDQVDLAEEELRIDTQKFVRSAWKSNAQLTIAPVIKDTPFADSDVRCLLKNKEATQINDGDFKQGKMPVRVRIINFGGDIIVCASPYNESEGRDFLLRVKPFTVSYDR